MSTPTYMDMEDAVREMDGSNLSGSTKRTINAMRAELIRCSEAKASADYAVRILEYWTGRLGEGWKLRDLADEAAKRIKRQQDSIIEALGDSRRALEVEVAQLRSLAGEHLATALSLGGVGAKLSFGYGVVDKDGKPWWSEDCVCQDAGPLEEVVARLNDDTFDDAPSEHAARRPYRVARLVAEEVSE